MKKFMYNVKKVASLAISIAPLLIGLDILFIMCSSILSVWSVKVSALFYSKSIENVKNNTFDGIIPVFISFVIIYIAVEIISALIDFVDFRIEKKFVNSLSEKFHIKVSKFNAIRFEDSNFLEKLQRAEGGIYSMDYYFFNLVGLVIKDIPYLMFLSVYLFTMRPVLCIIPFVIFIPIIGNQFLNMIEKKKINDDTIYINRKVGHYEDILCGETYVKDTRCFGIFGHFYKLHLDLFKELQSKQWKMNVRMQIYSTISKLLNLIGYYVVLWLLFDSVVLGYINVGEFAAVFAYIGKINSVLDNIVTNRFSTLLSFKYNGINYFVDLLDEEEENWGKTNCECISSIVMQNVSFVYPGSVSKAINDININIKRGEIIAIVGENGSGKTTLSKLLLGLYHPSNGKILYNGFEANAYTSTSFYKNSSAIFQNYYKYLFSLKENITISDLSIDQDIKKMENSIYMAGFNYNNERFSNGYDTILSKKFGGTELSGGEWQRLAIARGFYRDSNMIVLDEPTAAIDPIEEARVYNSFREICRGKTAIMITHRLGAVKLAHRILFMKNGKIVEDGTHEELLKRGGEYAELYRLQSQWYQ